MSRSAVAILENRDSNSQIYGQVYFEELPDGGTRIYGFVENVPGNHLSAAGNHSLHGFHIHQYGDMTNGCQSMGGHYNPFDQLHGSRVIYDQQGQLITNFERHLGDLGNLSVDKNGRAEFDFVDYMVQLSGPYSVIGRGLVMHSKADDLGIPGKQALLNYGSEDLSKHELESLKTGNAGSRIACGIIGLRS